jgi:hypothetical protein
MTHFSKHTFNHRVIEIGRFLPMESSVKSALAIDGYDRSKTNSIMYGHCCYYLAEALVMLFVSFQHSTMLLRSSNPVV